MAKLRAATAFGLLGALAVIVGTVLPWVAMTIPGQSGSGMPSFASGTQTEVLNGMMAGNASTLLLGIVLGVAAAWFWAGDQPRKALAVLAPTATAVVALAVWAISEKGGLLGFGAMGMDETVSLQAGVYVTLAGGLLALLASAFAFASLRGQARDTSAATDGGASEETAP